MADKALTETEWKKFAKGRDLKDAALLKALAAHEKAKEPDEQLKALALIEKEADALRKLVKGDKDFGAQLDAMDKAIAKEEKAAKAAQKEAESKESEEEGEDAPDLLTTKMIPLLRQVKQGEEMQVLLARGSKEVAVLMSRRSISSSRRKLLSDYLAEGAPKYDKGVCIFEENAYTFVLETQASGLAKKIKAALLKQVNLRLKVRVRGQEEGDVDDDGDEAGHELEAETHEAETHEPQAGQTESTSPQDGPDPLRADYERRQPGAAEAVHGHAQAAKLQPLLDFAAGKAEAGQWRAALQALDQIDKLLAAPAPGQGASLVKLQQARLGWEQARKKAQADLAEVARALDEAVRGHNEIEEAEDEYEEGDLKDGVRLLDQVFESLDGRLLDALDGALNAGPEQRPARQAEAGAILVEYRAYMATSALLAAIDDNPFRPCTVQKSLDRALAAVAAAL